MDWENDPELKQLRLEFVRSLPERAAKIREALQPTADSTAAIQELRQQAHKLAGLGGSYGYPRLSELSSAIEDQIDTNPKQKPGALAGALDWLAEVERIATS